MGDDDWALVRFYERFGARAEASHAAFHPWPRPDLREHVLSRDAIFVGGGNTANMLAIWRVHGFDALLREAWEARRPALRLERRDDLLVRGRRDRLVRARARGDARRARLPAGQRLPALRRRGAAAAGVHARSCAMAFRRGYAADDGVGLVFDGTELREVVTAVAGSRAYRVTRGGRGAAGGEAAVSREVKLSSADRVLYPESGITKGDLFDYYGRIAPVLVPHLRDRPFTMKR